MRRIRWTLALVALGIALPTGLLVHRALSSLALESAVRHEAVAERVFDEMERALSDFLLREEARAADDYARVGSAGDWAAVMPGADEPFVIGAFRIDPSGRIHASAPDPTAPNRVRLAVQATLRPAKLEEAANRLEPGRTRPLGKAETRVAERESKRATEADGLGSTAYDVLQSLNRAGELRSERQSKKSRSSAPQAAAPEALAYGAAESFDADAPPAEVFADDRARLQRTRRQDFERPETRASAGAASLRKMASAGADTDRAPSLAVTVDPLLGRAAPGDALVLTRSVWRPAGVERQGLMLDRATLSGWLEARVLSESGLDRRARLRFASTAMPGALDASDPDGPARRYLHRFAEPFDALSAQLDLDPLPGLESTRPILALAALLAAVATIGLFAVDRMTRVAVDYAQRRSDFVAAVSHELKTPLTSIRMYAEMLRDGLVPSDAKRMEYHATITDEAERLSRLIDNVLELSRLEQHQRETQWVTGDLGETVRRATEKLRAHATREGFDLSLEIDAGLPPVRFDPDAVTQIVFNLIDNALKYAREAEPRRIEIEVAALAGGVRLRVRDHGPGVPEGESRRVFEPFYRVGEELTRTTTGTGIGLALVRELADDMGARVGGGNAPGGGFEVRLDLDGRDRTGSE